MIVVFCIFGDLWHAHSHFSAINKNEIFRGGGGDRGMKYKIVPTHKIVNITVYLARSVPSGVVKNSKRRDHCTETFEVANDIGPSIGMEKRKLVWLRSETTS
jgi:hypothetical protein